MANTFYRNRVTGIVQAHPKSGIGDSLNSDEIGQDGKPIKPFVALPITKDKIKSAKSLLGEGAKRSSRRVTGDTAPDTTDASPALGDSEQEGDQ